MELSVVIPVYNEEENVEPLLGEIRDVLCGLGKSYEVIVVDDGSKDGTFAVLSRLHRSNQAVKVVRLKRNFGQTAALDAGLAYADGNIVVLMDGDMQNDPADIPALLARIEEGNDLVAGWRHRRRDPWLRRRLPSMIANRLISWTTQVKLHDYGCTLKAMRKDVALFVEDARRVGSLSILARANDELWGRFVEAYERSSRPPLSEYTSVVVARWFGARYPDEEPWIVPFVDRVASWIDQRTITTSFAAEQTLTSDTVPVNVDAVLFWMVTALAEERLIRPVQVTMELMLALVPMAFLVGVARSRLARSAVADLVIDMRGAPARTALRDSLSRALHDPSLEIAFWLDGADRYVDARGQPVDLPHDVETRAVTMIERAGRRIAALVHDGRIRTALVTARILEFHPELGYEERCHVFERFHRPSFDARGRELLRCERDGRRRAFHLPDDVLQLLHEAVEPAAHLSDLVGVLHVQPFGEVPFSRGDGLQDLHGVLERCGDRARDHAAEHVRDRDHHNTEQDQCRGGVRDDGAVHHHRLPFRTRSDLREARSPRRSSRSPCRCLRASRCPRRT